MNFDLDASTFSRKSSAEKIAEFSIKK